MSYQVRVWSLNASDRDDVPRVTSKMLKERHYCPQECQDKTGNMKRCWNHFYLKHKEEDIPDIGFMQDHVPGWFPLLDAGDKKLKDANSGWHLELASLTSFIKDNRTATFQTFNRLKEDGKLRTIVIGQDTDYEIHQILQHFKADLIKTRTTIEFYMAGVAFDVEGQNRADQEHHHGIKQLPSKLHMGDGYNAFLEIQFPLRKTAGGWRIASDTEFPEPLREFFKLFGPGADNFLLGHDLKDDVLSIQNAIRALTNGEDWDFPVWLDTAVLWTRLGGYAKKSYGIQPMLLELSGGSMLKKFKLSTQDWKQPWFKLPPCATTYNLGDLKAVFNIYLCFFPINIPRVFPSHQALQDAIGKGNVKPFLETLVDTVNRSCFMMEFDGESYRRAGDFNRTACVVQDFSGEDKLDEWRSWCIALRNPLTSSLYQIWPKDAPCVTSEGWSPGDPGTLRVYLRDLGYMEESKPAEPPDCRQEEVCILVEETCPLELREVSNLPELLKNIHNNKEEAWKILESELKKEPDVSLGWIKRANPKGHKSLQEGAFMFGTRKNYLRVKKIAEGVNQRLQIGDLHKGIAHRGGRKLRERKARRESRGQNKSRRRSEPSDLRLVIERKRMRK